jgi:hypothetical protein
MNNRCRSKDVQTKENVENIKAKEEEDKKEKKIRIRRKGRRTKKE